MKTPGASDFQLALDAMRDGVILWSADGRAIVANAAASRLFDLPDGLLRPGARRVDVMTHMARRGDYGPTDDPDGLARELSERFATGAVTSLTRRLPDGRHLRADARLLEGGRLVVTYQEVQPEEPANVGAGNADAEPVEIAHPSLFTVSKSALADFAEYARGAAIECDVAKIAIDMLLRPHRPSGLPSGRMAVYCFFLNGQALKIGIAGPNSDARYRSQHYNPNSAQSTLARSLLNNPAKAAISPLRSNFVGDWIKSNTDRVNFLVPASFEKRVLSQLEAFLHARWRPIYEGRGEG
jgi:hypothetical protein